MSALSIRNMNWVIGQKELEDSPSLLTAEERAVIRNKAAMSGERLSAEYWAKGVTLYWDEALEALNAMLAIAELEAQDDNRSPYISGGEIFYPAQVVNNSEIPF